jgi:hypothetical protein
MDLEELDSEQISLRFIVFNLLAFYLIKPIDQKD